MEPFQDIKSRLIPFDMTNVDTDQIIPKQFSTNSKTGYGSFFLRLAFESAEIQRGSVRNEPKYKKTSVLTRETSCGVLRTSSGHYTLWN